MAFKTFKTQEEAIKIANKRSASATGRDGVWVTQRSGGGFIVKPLQDAIAGARRKAQS